MIAVRVHTQKEVDDALAREFGIKPTGKFTTDKTQQLYADATGDGFMIPAFKQGYSYYFVEDLIEHLRTAACRRKLVSSHTFEEIEKDETPVHRYRNRGEE